MLPRDKTNSLQRVNFYILISGYIISVYNQKIYIDNMIMKNRESEWKN